MKQFMERSNLIESNINIIDNSLLYDMIVSKLIQNFLQVFEAELGSTITNKDAIRYLDELSL